MEMQHVRYFLALCEEQNVTRAAERCGIKQPTLTRAIKELEAEFGGPLFARGWKATRLSGLGAVVRPHIANIDRSAADARRAATTFFATSSVFAFKPNSVRKIVYSASITAAVILTAGAAVLLSRPGIPSRPLQIAGIAGVHELKAQIDAEALPRYDTPTEAEE